MALKKTQIMEISKKGTHLNTEGSVKSDLSCRPPFFHVPRRIFPQKPVPERTHIRALHNNERKVATQINLKSSAKLLSKSYKGGAA